MATLTVLATKVFNEFQGKDWIGMDKKKIRISATNLFANDLPDVKVILEEKNAIYTFNGVLREQSCVCKIIKAYGK